MLVTSRCAAEYRAMFGLEDVPGDWSVLDCCAGGASFAAESGGGVVAVDPAYAVARQDLAEQLSTGLREGELIIDRHRDRFDWGWYGTPARRRAMREEAARRFLADLGANPGRYLAAALPALPLADRSVDLALCSHMLFTWANRFDLDWHRAALNELIRVARHEVRVYPLVVQGTADPVGFLGRLCRELSEAGHRWQMRPVRYRFQRGAHTMLHLSELH